MTDKENKLNKVKYYIEIQDIPEYWEYYDEFDTFVEACKYASIFLEADYRVGGKEERIRIIDGEGTEY